MWLVMLLRNFLQYFTYFSLHTHCVMFLLLVLVSSVGFAFVLKLHFLAFVKFLVWVVFVDCIGVGLLIATLFW